MLSLPTAYLPPLDYFAAMVQAGEFFIDARRPCRKQTFANRACIVTSQGILKLSIPCTKPRGSHTPDGEILVCNLEKWQRDHWRGIVTAYNKSPYFLYYRDELETFYTQKAEKLIDFNNALLDFVVRKLRLPIKRVQAPSDIASGDPAPIVLDFSPKQPEIHSFTPYLQTFPCETALHTLSILDLMFNLGPESLAYLQTARLVTSISRPLP